MIDPTCTRLRSAIALLNVKGPARALNVGCGTFPDASAMLSALPGWLLIGIDIDGAALQRAAQQNNGIQLLQADGRDAPALFHAPFGLVVVRHPDVFRRNAWEDVLAAMPALIAPDGALLVTLYTTEEVERARGFGLALTPLPDDRLAPSDLSGADRYALSWRPASAG